MSAQQTDDKITSLCKPSPHDIDIDSSEYNENNDTASQPEGMTPTTTTAAAATTKPSLEENDDEIAVWEMKNSEFVSCEITERKSKDSVDLKRITKVRFSEVSDLSNITYGLEGLTLDYDDDDDDNGEDNNNKGDDDDYDDIIEFSRRTNTLRQSQAFPLLQRKDIFNRFTENCDNIIDERPSFIKYDRDRQSKLVNSRRRSIDDDPIDNRSIDQIFQSIRSIESSQNSKQHQQQQTPQPPENNIMTNVTPATHSDENYPKQSRRQLFHTSRRSSSLLLEKFTSFKHKKNQDNDPEWDDICKSLLRMTDREAKLLSQKTNENNETMLHTACRAAANGRHSSSYCAVIETLLAVCPQVAAQTCRSRGRLPIHYWCEAAYGSHATAASTIDKNDNEAGYDNSDDGDDDGFRETILKCLIDAYPSSITVQDHDGQTPLHLATFGSSLHHPDDITSTTKPTTTSPSITALSLLLSTDVANITNNMGQYPLTLEYLINTAITIDCQTNISSESSLSSARTTAMSCLTTLLDAKLELCYLPRFEVAIQSIALLEETSPGWFLDQAVVHPYIQAVLNWRITRLFTVLVLMLDSYVAVMNIVCYRMVSFEAHMARFGSIAEGSNVCRNDGGDCGEVVVGVSGVAILCLFVGAGYMTLREMLQAGAMIHRGEFASWLFDFWNLNDCLSIGFIFWSANLMYNGTGDDQTLRMMTVFTTGLMWVEALSILKTINHNFAVFVSGLTNMVWTLRPFLFTIGLLLVAFAQMFHSQYQGTDICPPNNVDSLSSPSFIENNFCAMTNSYLKVYTMLVGGGVDEAQFIHDPTSLVLSVIFSFVILILLLNILIAIVTDSYGIVVERSENVFWRQRLSFVFEVDQSYIFLRDLFRTIWHFITGHRRHDNDIDGDIGDYQSFHGLKQRVNRMAIMWDVFMIILEENNASSSSSAGTSSNMVDLQHLIASQSDWFLLPVVTRFLETPYWFRKLSATVIFPFWILLGGLSMGILWPPQLKRLILCPCIKDRDGARTDESISKSDMEELSDQVKSKLTAIERQIKDDTNGICSKVDRIDARLSLRRGGDGDGGDADESRRQSGIENIQKDVIQIRTDVDQLHNKMSRIEALLERVLLERENDRVH